MSRLPAATQILVLLIAQLWIAKQLFILLLPPPFRRSFYLSMVIHNAVDLDYIKRESLKRGNPASRNCCQSTVPHV
ncbi:MAG: hypothetical protein WBG92_20150 [Thiohalocapsa sp.]